MRMEAPRGTPPQAQPALHPQAQASAVRGANSVCHREAHPHVQASGPAGPPRRTQRARPTAAGAGSQCVPRVSMRGPARDAPPHRPLPRSSAGATEEERRHGAPTAAPSDGGASPQHAASASPVGPRAQGRAKATDLGWTHVYKDCTGYSYGGALAGTPSSLQAAISGHLHSGRDSPIRSRVPRRLARRPELGP